MSLLTLTLCPHNYVPIVVHSLCAGTPLLDTP